MLALLIVGRLQIVMCFCIVRVDGDSLLVGCNGLIELALLNVDKPQIVMSFCIVRVTSDSLLVGFNCQVILALLIVGISPTKMICSFITTAKQKATHSVEESCKQFFHRNHLSQSPNLTRRGDPFDRQANSDSSLESHRPVYRPTDDSPYLRVQMTGHYTL